ncbi:MAG: dTDP-4-dehydrorhamnose 3,5-epimerase family protein [Candidatus Aenigmarchaeota archaeon]|nr:dTDP-4-dehydrorhamnose 3,5-epimerase family protein [Candidatus Aenigmarchaeota archaeon]
MKGVEIKELKIHSDGRGYLFEGLRKDDKIFSGSFGQTLISVVNPGVIKGWHRHEKQTDYTLCAKGNIVYGVSDGKNTETYVIGEKHNVMIKVSPGIWHGYMAIGKEALIVHVMDTIFDPKDTERKDPMFFGDVWSEKAKELDK